MTAAAVAPMTTMSMAWTELVNKPGSRVFTVCGFVGVVVGIIAQKLLVQLEVFKIEALCLRTLCDIFLLY